MRFLVVVADSLRYDSALQHEGLLGVRDWDAVVPCGAHAPYTPSSLTTIATGLHPVQHRYWTFPPHSEPQPAAENYVFKSDIPAPVAWFSSHPPSTYAWPDSSRLNSVADLQRFLQVNSHAVALVHLWESHIPYDYDHSIDKCIEDMGQIEDLEGRIEYTHHGVDAAFEIIRPVLEEAPDDTIVLITGDHGEALGEENPFPDGRENRWIHEHTLREELLVPMLIYGLDIKSNFVRHSQIVPTIREKFGLNPIRRLLGAPLDVDFLTGPISYSMASCRWAIPEQGWEEHGILVHDAEQGRFMTASSHVGSTAHLYADPSLNAVAEAIGGDVFDRIEDYLKMHRYSGFLQSGDLRESHEEMDKDEAVKEKLRALGYLS